MISYQRKDRRIYSDSHCLLCGDNYGICKGEHRAHRPETCEACGTPQCWTNGLAHGTCSVCGIGFLGCFAGSNQKCGYKGCQGKAIAEAPRIKRVCREHASRARSTAKNLTIAQYIDRRLSFSEPGSTAKGERQVN